MVDKNVVDGIIYDSMDEYVIQEFINVGGDSIVFKGMKKSVERTYALKFREVDKSNDFWEVELPITKKLEKCSTGKLAGFIPYVPENVKSELYRIIPDNVKKDNEKGPRCAGLFNPNAQYFCIVEDFINGYDLSAYCQGDAANGIRPHAPGENAEYGEVVSFQRKLLTWTKQFCKIMMNVTDEHGCLHLDIKPENIMIAAETESVVVIDFGKAIELPENSADMSLYDIFSSELVAYGTIGYSAPECCDNEEIRRALNYSGEIGRVDVRSDIFSFGAALWNCINPGIQIRVNENGYFRRDLFNTPKGYTPELESIIMKCTEKDPAKRFQSYEELERAAVIAEKKLNMRDKPSKLIWLVGGLTALLTVFLVFFIYLEGERESLTFERARYNFDVMADEYTEHSIAEFKDTAIALVKADEGNTDSYMDILELSYTDNYSVSSQELEEVLFNCLSYTDDASIREKYINTVMQNITDADIKSVSEAIAIRKSLEDVRDCDGMRIAQAITDYQSNCAESYETLLEYKDRSEYSAALRYLAKILSNDTAIVREIAEHKGASEDAVYQQLIMLKGV
ncbi:MAG: protein kinase [Ruminococcus sp.]|nr:protein kinase [Ruminococcus sp.]